MPGGIAGMAAGDFIDPNTDGDNDETTVTGTIAGLPQFQSGADEPLTFSLVTDTSALEAQNLTSGGVDADLFGGRQRADGDGWSGRRDGVHVHAESGRGVGVRSGGPARPSSTTGAAENDLTIFLGSLIQATDFDGDTAPGGAVQIVVNDDTPIAIARRRRPERLTRTALLRIADAGHGRRHCWRRRGDVAGEAVVATGSVAALFQSGADEPLTYGFAANAVATLQALRSDVGRRCAELCRLVRHTVTASTAGAGDTVFTFTLTRRPGRGHSR